MSTKMTAWGIGPILFGLSGAYFTLAAIFHFTNPDLFFITQTPHLAFIVIGICLIVVGILLWILAVRVIDQAFDESKLLTNGVYSLVRNPMYSAFIVFIFPGIALCFRSWLLLTVPLVAFIIFRSLIGREEEYLEEKFGQTYLNYKSKVHALVPMIHFGTKL